MKKILPILLLTILAFNTIGYKFALNYLTQQSSISLNNNIESNNYSTDDLVEIKIELNNPYISDHNYEEAYGETVVKGKHYQFVKKKISENTLYLMCLPNDKKEAINNTKNKLADNNASTTQNKKDNKNDIPTTAKVLQAEFLAVNQITFENLNALQADAKSFSLYNNKLKPQFNLLEDLQPPDNKI